MQLNYATQVVRHMGRTQERDIYDQALASFLDPSQPLNRGDRPVKGRHPILKRKQFGSNSHNHWTVPSFGPKESPHRTQFGDLPL